MSDAQELLKQILDMTSSPASTRSTLDPPAPAITKINRVESITGKPYPRPVTRPLPYPQPHATPQSDATNAAITVAILPLHDLVCLGDPSAVAASLAAGAIVDALDDKNFTPLHYALQIDNNLVIVNILLDAGADYNFVASKSHHSIGITSTAAMHSRLNTRILVSVLKLNPIHRHVKRVISLNYAALADHKTRNPNKAPLRVITDTRDDMLSLQHRAGTVRPVLQAWLDGKPYACRLDGCFESLSELSPRPLKVCLCRTVGYCCKAHQVADWGRHKGECGRAVPEDPSCAGTRAGGKKGKGKKGKTGRK